MQRKVLFGCGTGCSSMPSGIGPIGNVEKAGARDINPVSPMTPMPYVVLARVDTAYTTPAALVRAIGHGTHRTHQILSLSRFRWLSQRMPASAFTRCGHAWPFALGSNGPTAVMGGGPETRGNPGRLLFAWAKGLRHRFKRGAGLVG
jgi:hypothetical protein